MEDVTLGEVYRDLLEIKKQIKDAEECVSTEMRNLNSFMTRIDRRTIRLEERATILGSLAGLVTGLVVQAVARIIGL